MRLSDVKLHGSGTWDVGKPKYPHDCDQCEFLGQYTETMRVAVPVKYDLYVCPREDGSINTLVARYGFEGAEYISGYGKHILRGESTLPLRIAMLILLDRMDFTLEEDTK
jgi:hypothetical protein